MTGAATAGPRRPDPGPVARERGWGRTLLALAVGLAVAAAPLWPPSAGLAAALVRAVVPVEQVLLLVVPALAACTLVGWWAGGRLLLAACWLIVAGWVLAQPLAGQAAGYAPFARGWAVALAGAFGVVSLVSPRQPFFPRALQAVALAAAIALAAVLGGGGSPRALTQVMAGELDRRVDASLDGWQRHAAGVGWQRVAADQPELADRAAASSEELRALPRPAATLAPALVALESLAALALAWSLYHRLSRARLGPPIGRLAGFRFNDQLVWGLVLGATLLLVPSLAALRPLGANLLAFFGALYALRGLGVLRWLAPERVAAGVALGVAILLPVLGVALLVGAVGAIALAVGLGDTWGDWRRRGARPAAR